MIQKVMGLHERKKELGKALEVFESMGNFNPTIIKKYEFQLEEVKDEIKSIKKNRIKI